MKLKWTSIAHAGKGAYADVTEPRVRYTILLRPDRSAYFLAMYSTEGFADLGQFPKISQAKARAQKHYDEHYNISKHFAAVPYPAKPISDKTFSISIGGVKTPVRVIERPDGTFAAGIVLSASALTAQVGKTGRVDVIGVGATREAAMHDMLAKRAAHTSTRPMSY